MRKKSIEAERGQEDEAAQTTATAFDVTQEVSVLKTCPQLPVSVSQAIRAEEVPSGYTTSTTGVISDSFPISEDENDPLKHVEEELKRHRAQLEKREKEREEEEEIQQQSEEKVENTLPLNSENSLSPLQPHPNTITAMSRIYNLESVSSKWDRTVDIPSVHLVKVKPLLSNAQQGDRKASSDEDTPGVQTIQRQIEQFQMKEKELLKSCASPNTPLKDREKKGQQSPRGVLKYKVNDNVKTPKKDQETPESKVKVSPWRVCSPTNQLKQSNQNTNSILRSQSPDNALKPSDKAPTPASSPSSTPPAQSPSVSPSPTPSPSLFSIRSASGGQVRRGATITVTPRKPVEGGGVTGPAAAARSNSPAQQAESPSTGTEPAKKKFPTVDEIEVIGGYQNLEKSCLVKYRATPKRTAAVRMKQRKLCSVESVQIMSAPLAVFTTVHVEPVIGNVCFDEDQLEQVCEYPSETSMLACTPYPQDPWRMEKQQGEEVQEEEAEMEEIAIVSKSTRNVGMVTGGALRVGQCHPLFKKHNV
ncbi:Phostensin [Dissostichus eleginoides]|uniref:Phostensin n=1 Tax=Dissostichus eleginoides TaxID=100907 RepID=A0AAD9BA74_DISEL|nr:Phostensin [Dissostichus eleginoides]